MPNAPADHLEAFRKHIEIERGLASWPSYQYPLRGYLRFMEALGHDLTTATRDDAIAYLELKKSAGLKGSSLYLLAICIRQFHRFLVARGRAAAGPTDLKLPKFKQRLPDPLSVEEMERLLSVPTGAKFHRIRMFCALQLMWSTGMRVSEITGLRMSQTNLEDSQVKVIRKHGLERIIPIGANTKKALIMYLDARKGQLGSESDALFLTSRGRPWARCAFWWQLARLAGEAGLPGRVHPHRVRHGFATVMLMGGASLRIVQEALSHANITTTQRYTHVLPDDLKKACEMMHPRF